MLQYFISMEESILLWIQNSMRNEVLTPIFIFITMLGNNGFIGIAVSVILLIVKKTRKLGFISFTAMAFCALIVNVILKNLVARIRPYEAISGLSSLIGAQIDFSFPSGHTSMSFAVAVVIFCGLPKKIGVPALVFAFLMGFSRLYVGVHYPSDVLCGALIGTIVALLIYRYANKK